MTYLYVLLILLLAMNSWVFLNSLFLLNLKKAGQMDQAPLVSLLVPLRNEERNVPELIASLKRITYPNIEFLLLDDHSEDRTQSLLQKHCEQDKRFKIVRGKALPEGWNGKVHACHQLSEYADGRYYLFLDADARVSPKIIERSLATLWKYEAKMLSGFPNYPTNHLLAHLLVPLQHMIIFLHLPLAVANFTKRPPFTAACGIFIFAEREAYEKIGGHRSVKNSLVEDVHLARRMKQSGFKMILVNITDAVVSYMYESSRETWAGFKKNIYSGLGRSPLMVMILTIFYSVVFLLPFPLMLYGIITFELFLILPYVLNVMMKMFMDWKSGHPLWLSFLLPFSILALIAIMLTSMFVDIRGKSYTWKGRSYQ
ncbi:glycosyltransferase [Thalassobacillus hwangdonensis]|uniref:4,4'-diaponeurosporenoate glycosyltransferase n=1 Tax=Thalassobacillus hwangdonensis TaxID=546108 RepID=A0ABW3KWP6_9BACI